MFDRLISYQARQRPRASAIATLGGDISFAQFDDEIAAVSFWAQTLKLEPRRPVVVRIADRYLHWLVLFALARLGVPSASVADAASPADVLRFSPQRLIADRDNDAAVVSPTCPVSEFSIRTARGLIASEGRLRSCEGVDPATQARVATSSGTTGAPKAIGFSWAELSVRYPSFLRVAPQIVSRLLPLVGPEMGGFEASLCAWSIGGTVVFGPRNVADLADSLPQLAPGVLAGAPVQIQMLMNALPDGALPQSSMSVALFGAHCPSELRREISLRLSSDIYNLYGSTEAGLMAWASSARLAEPTAVGFVPPWVDLEIANAEDQACPANVSGALRVRGPTVARRYLDDANASAAHFRDGWFYPGDVGLLTTGGLLHLHGRTDEVMNLGGEKVLPLMLEEAARAFPHVADAAAFMAPGRDGADAPWLAVVESGALDRGALFAHLRDAGAVAINLICVSQIPRNARGKILKDPLKQFVVDASRAITEPPPQGQDQSVSLPE